MLEKWWCSAVVWCTGFLLRSAVCVVVVVVVVVVLGSVVVEMEKKRIDWTVEGRGRCCW